jgi:predicted Zn finger-like uncharacterized protein
MFLYTICPACQAGYDVTDLLRGKKMRCKSCAQLFNVAAAPRPRHLPPPAAFVRPQAPAAAFTAQPLPALDRAKPIVDLATIVRSGRPFDQAPRRAQRPAPVSNTGGWSGRGGLGAGAILVFFLIRGCVAVTSSRTSYNQPPPVVMPQMQPQFNPRNNPPLIPNGGKKRWPPQFGDNGLNQPLANDGVPPLVDEGQLPPQRQRRGGQVPPPGPDRKPPGPDD